MNRLGITNYFVNTVVTALQAPEWETLLQRSSSMITHNQSPSNLYYAAQDRGGCYAISTDRHQHFCVVAEPMSLSNDWGPNHIHSTRSTNLREHAAQRHYEQKDFPIC